MAPRASKKRKVESVDTTEHESGASRLGGELRSTSRRKQNECDPLEVTKSFRESQGLPQELERASEKVRNEPRENEASSKQTRNEPRKNEASSKKTQHRSKNAPQNQSRQSKSSSRGQSGTRDSSLNQSGIRDSSQEGKQYEELQQHQQILSQGSSQRTYQGPSQKAVETVSQGTNQGPNQGPSQVPSQIQQQQSSEQQSREQQSRERQSQEQQYQEQGSSQQFDTWTQEVRDAHEEAETTDTFDDNTYESYRLYGTLNTKVVGIQYYRGRANRGEFVVLRREPRNPYDSQAIQVLNVGGVQVGHVPRGNAAKLAPLMDAQSILVEGLLTSYRGDFDIPMDIRIYGSSDPVAMSALKQQMQALRLPVKDAVEAERERARKEKERKKLLEQQRKKELKEAARTAGSVRKGDSATQFEQDRGSAGFANLTIPNDDPALPSMEDIIGASAQFDPRALGDVVDKYGSGEDVLSSLPFAEQPKELATKLLPYQRQGLAWMIDRENLELPAKGSTETVQLWKRDPHGFINIATRYHSTNPRLASGGILADDMGLGKTLQTIALVIADPKKDGSPTLIVSPLSVMSNWSSQIREHLTENHQLKVLIYHGSNATLHSPSELGQYNVVVTTYQTLSREYFSTTSKQPPPLPRKQGLFSTSWRRIVLDEGHNIRNPKSKMAQAVCAIEAASRWSLTGTPIINNLKDLYSQIKFLRLTGGLEMQEVFSGTLTRPLNQGIADADVLLQALMSTLCMRRMKDMKFIDLRLPTFSSHKYTVQWHPEEFEKYQAFDKQAKGLLVQFQSGQKGGTTYSHLLEVLLRLRQCCNHTKLCGNARVTQLLEELQKNKKADLTPANVETLRDLLRICIDSQEDCAVCLEPLHDPVITPCAHAFGASCIERVIETQQKCPMCRAPLKEKEELVRPRHEFGDHRYSDMDLETSSSKIEALLDILKATRKSEPGKKTVVFSQWTSFLDIVQKQLQNNGFKFCRLDGTMIAGKRDASINLLNGNPECTVLLASLGVCSVGLNLTAASQVVLCDTWWAPAIEDQATDRVYRLGQTKPVTVFRLVMEDSVEERVIGIQQEKRKLAMKAFQETTMRRGQEKQARLDDIRQLLGTS